MVWFLGGGGGAEGGCLLRLQLRLRVLRCYNYGATQVLVAEVVVLLVLAANAKVEEVVVVVSSNSGSK